MVFAPHFTKISGTHRFKAFNPAPFLEGLELRRDFLLPRFFETMILPPIPFSRRIPLFSFKVRAKEDSV